MFDFNARYELSENSQKTGVVKLYEMEESFFAQIEEWLYGGRWSIHGPLQEIMINETTTEHEKGHAEMFCSINAIRKYITKRYKEMIREAIKQGLPVPENIRQVVKGNRTDKKVDG
jgi:uncharacterized NAD-dependent epimerase/dehydratase family protein